MSNGKKKPNREALITLPTLDLGNELDPITSLPTTEKQVNIIPPDVTDSYEIYRDTINPGTHPAICITYLCANYPTTSGRTQARGQ